MICEHELDVKAKCPVNGEDDVYSCTVRTARVVKVEDILAAAAVVAGRTIFQEDLTRELAGLLGAGVEVETVGWHSGVRTTVRAGGGS